MSSSSFPTLSPPEARPLSAGIDSSSAAGEILFGELMDLATDAVVTADEEFRIVHFNASATRIFGHARSDVIGRPLDMLVPEAVREIHYRHMRGFAASPDVSRMLGERSDIMGLRADGREFPAEASISKLNLGGRRLLMVWLRDVSLRRRDEAARQFLTEAGSSIGQELEYSRTVERVSRFALAALGDSCIADIYLGPESREVSVADRDPEMEDLARVMRQRFPPLYESHPVTEARRTAKTVMIAVMDDEVRRRVAIDDEHARMLRRLGWRSAIYAPLTARGHALGVLSCYSRTRTFDAHDQWLATEYASRAALALDNAVLYRQARQAARTRDDVLAIVSHDLRSPLSTINICAGALLDPVPAPIEGVHAMAEAIRHSAHWAESIIADLLDVASMEAGRLALERRSVLPAELLDRAREQFAPQAQAAGLTLEVDGGVELPAVDVDPERILQVLFNLLSNAVKFTPPGGSITVTARHEPSVMAVRFSIQDSGIGISTDDLPNVFNRFWQVVHTRRGGAGLGLAIAKGIAEAHGGAIDVTSREGVGSTFSFTVRIAGEPDFH